MDSLEERSWARLASDPGSWYLSVSFTLFSEPMCRIVKPCCGKKLRSPAKGRFHSTPNMDLLENFKSLPALPSPSSPLGRKAWVSSICSSSLCQAKSFSPPSRTELGLTWTEVCDEAILGVHLLSSNSRLLLLTAHSLQVRL